MRRGGARFKKHDRRHVLILCTTLKDGFLGANFPHPSK